MRAGELVGDLLLDLGEGVSRTFSTQSRRMRPKRPTNQAPRVSRKRRLPGSAAGAGAVCVIVSVSTSHRRSLAGGPGLARKPSPAAPLAARPTLQASAPFYGADS